MRCSNGYELAHPGKAAQPLYVVSRDQSAHAESDDIERFLFCEICLDVEVQLLCEFGKSHSAIVRYEIQAVNGKSVVLKIRLHPAEHSDCIVNSVDQNYGIPSHKVDGTSLPALDWRLRYREYTSNEDKSVNIECARKRQLIPMTLSV